jgi:hypothetical protein
MYILCDKTTHYATQRTLIILSGHLLRSKNIYIYLTNAVLTAFNTQLYSLLTSHPDAGVW